MPAYKITGTYNIVQDSIKTGDIVLQAVTLTAWNKVWCINILYIRGVPVFYYGLKIYPEQYQ